MKVCALARALAAEMVLVMVLDLVMVLEQVGHLVLVVLVQDLGWLQE